MWHTSGLPLAEAGGGRAPSDPQDIRWRAEHEKTGYEHRTPVPAEALAVLERARARSSGLETAAVSAARTGHPSGLWAPWWAKARLWGNL